MIKPSKERIDEVFEKYKDSCGDLDLRGFRSAIEELMEEDNDTIEKIILDYIALLELDKDGMVGNAPSYELHNDAKIASAVNYAKHQLNSRKYQLLLHILNKRLKPIEPIN